MTKKGAARLVLVGVLIIAGGILTTITTSGEWIPPFCILSCATGLSLIIYACIKAEWIK